MPLGKYAPEQLGTQVLGPVLERVRSLPGVQSAALISLLPIQSAWVNGNYTVDGEPPPEPGREALA